MSNAKRLDEKDPGETIVLCWDYTADLGEEGTIDGTPVIVISIDNDLRRNTEDPITLVPVGAAAVDGKTVLQAVSGGADGIDYQVQAQAPASGTPASLIYKTSLLPVRYQ
jgi:hypothetical protein